MIARRAFLDLLTLRPVTKAQERKPDAWIAVLDDSRAQRLMGTVAVTLEKGYSLTDLVKQMADDLGLCGESRRKG